MTVYESLITEDKQPPCPPLNPCCEEPCDEPSFWDLLPQCQLNWIALGLAALAIGFGLIGLGAINVGNVLNLSTVSPPKGVFDSTTLAQGTSLITSILGAIALLTWTFFKACNDDWGIVVVGSLVGASGFPLVAIGLIYITIAEVKVFPPGFDPTWLNIATSLITLSIAGFLFLAYRLYYSPCHECISAKKAVIVSLIFLAGGSAAYSLGRLLWVAVITHQFYTFNPPLFPATAFVAFIFVSIVNIMLVVALGWYILDCAVEGCFFTFLPLLASAAPLGNWALYRVGLNILPFAYLLATQDTLLKFAVAIGFVSIAALILTYVVVKNDNNAAALVAASSIPLLYAIATFTNFATAANLLNEGRFIDDILIGIFSAIEITAVIDFFLGYNAKCPIPTIIYGIASGSFGWAVIYLYATYSSNLLNIFNTTPHFTDSTTLNVGLIVILGIVITSIIYVRFVACDELLSALTLLNVALLTVGTGGFFGTLAYYILGFPPAVAPLNSQDVMASVFIYAIFVLAAFFLPQSFARCEDIKRQIIIAVAALSAGIAAVDFGRAVVLGRAVAYDPSNIGKITFSPLIYIASAVGAAFIGQIIVWKTPQSNLYTALLASFMGLFTSGISLQIIFLVNGVDLVVGQRNFELVGTPWLIFTLILIPLLAFLQLKSLCIPQSCRFSIGLLIPALTIAVVGKVAGASAVLGALYNAFATGTLDVATTSAVNSRMILLNSIIPLAAFFVSLMVFRCTTHLAYLPTSIAFTAVIYAVSQFELLTPLATLFFALNIFIPFLNPITQIYYSFNFSATTTPAAISAYVTFFTQTYLVYFLFLAPALIVGFMFTRFKQISATVLGTAIAVTGVGLGAVGIANVISGLLSALNFMFGFVSFPITIVITFDNFLEGIQSQLILFVVGVSTALFISFGECCYNIFC